MLLDPSVSGPFCFVKPLDKPREIKFCELSKSCCWCIPDMFLMQEGWLYRRAILFLPAVQGLDSILYSSRSKKMNQSSRKCISKQSGFRKCRRTTVNPRKLH
jgi:hypothetical protein